MKRLNYLVLIALMLAPVPAGAQAFLKNLKQAAENAVNKAVGETVESVAPAAAQSGNTLAASLPAPAGNATVYYVSRNGSNRNDGLSPANSLKNIQKAIDLASDGDEIRVAEGNYYGLLNRGNIIIDKPLYLYGGYSSDFTERDVLKYLTTIAPTPESSGSSQGRGTVQLRSINKPGTKLVIDGFIFNKGNALAYNQKGEGWPEGVESPMLVREGGKGLGGEDLKQTGVITLETYFIYFDGDKGIVNNLDVTVHNCTFVNGPNTTICGLLKGSLTVDNCVFVNNRSTIMDVRGADPNVMTAVNFTNNTVLFVWSYTDDLASQGFGFRFQPGTCCDIENNIIGLTIFSALDRTHIDSDAKREAKRKDSVVNNIFFLNRVTDLTIPGGAMLTRVKVEDFDDVEALYQVKGNRSLSDPSLFKGRIDEAYLNAFLNVSYSETTSYDASSAANTFRSAMGMNMTGTMTSSVTMYANRYPWKKALDVFGAVQGCGAQLPK